ncbi:trehalose 6-phosphate phosphatase [Natronoarchaeum philippinense]|uniref:Trehalose 6-phosphate phosphatase n=1 Tax=Natronoarchaeum philippinense TaxID=558529 RepID=A0A285NTM9_NATPI|nr:trehalose-phosphatase [Natronoarchaeum philippinense]SNZ12263.1 trehalose 6-phosphate phosphatase [Natronoarchaeum philippinense]
MGGDDAVPATLRSTFERRLDRADGLLFLADFDGTLAPIVEDPTTATPLDGVPESLRALRDTDRIAVGLVSGRALADLRERAGVSGVHYAGNHGLELQAPAAEGEDADPEIEIHPDAAAAADAVGEVAGDVASRIDGIDGAAVEDKGVTATVHYRGVDESAVPNVQRAVEAAVADADADLRITSGKKIFEIRPAVDWDKGAAVEWLRDRLVPDDERWLTVYVGDDVTDEDAFAALDDGVGIAVGRTETAAEHALSDPEAVRALVGWLAGTGRRHVAGDADGEA